MRLPFADSPEFRRLLDGGPVGEPDLARVALEIARDAYPEVDVETYLARIDGMADRARERLGPSEGLRGVLGQINWVLYVEESFAGNVEDYYDPRNSYLNEVLDRKTGLPITLSVVYWRVAEALGLSVGGLNLPAHFMIRVGRNDESVVVDPFHGGAILDRTGCERRIAEVVGRPVALDDRALAPCQRADVVARMLSNLKAVHVRQDDFPSALPVQRRLTALRPHDPAELRDLGMLCLRLDRPAEALAPLRAAIAAAPDSAEADELRALARAAGLDAAGRN